MKRQPSKQRCFHAYLLCTVTTSTATRICFNPSCLLGLTLGSSFANSVSCVFFVFFMSIVKYLFYTVIGLVN